MKPTIFKDKIANKVWKEWVKDHDFSITILNRKRQGEIDTVLASQPGMETEEDKLGVIEILKFHIKNISEDLKANTDKSK